MQIVAWRASPKDEGPYRLALILQAYRGAVVRQVTEQSTRKLRVSKPVSFPIAKNLTSRAKLLQLEALDATTFITTCLHPTFILDPCETVSLEVKTKSVNVVNCKMTVKLEKKVAKGVELYGKGLGALLFIIHSSASRGPLCQGNGVRGACGVISNKQHKRQALKP